MRLAAGCIVLPGLESWLLVGLFCAILLFIEAAGLLIFLRGTSKAPAIPPLLTGIWCLALGGWTQAHTATIVLLGASLAVILIHRRKARLHSLNTALL